MLTLQNILDSDSLSTLVAKINANFSSIALSNGGPQGVRGEQGIPGLPGKQGATGPAGPAGSTGPAPGIIPFAKTGASTPYIMGGPTYASWNVSYNDLSYEFLETGPNAWGPKGPTGSGFAVSGQLYFDNNQLGWWKYLTVPDPTPGVPNTIDSNQSEYYVQSPHFSFGAGGTWTGPDWYFYPLNLSSITNLTQGVWTADKTNYLGTLTASLYGSPTVAPTFPSQTPYGIANARMNSKFGSVWISSFDGNGPSAVPNNSENLNSNETPYIYYWDYANGPRLNSGVDRSLFKMSIDGPLYFDMMKARAYRDTDTIDIIGNPWTVNGGAIPIPGGGVIDPNAAGSYEDYFPRPIYNASIDSYAPIAFYTGRNDGLTPAQNTTLGYLQFTNAPSGTGVPTTKIHLFTTRQNNEFFGAGGLATLTSSTNAGEALWDVRRFITSNQYLNMFPQDTEDYTSVDIQTSQPYNADGFDARTGNLRLQWNSTTEWKAYQGYHSVFTGQKVVENAASGNQSAIPTVDTWIYGDRQSWYGTSIFGSKPDIQSNANQAELIRSAGLMVDSKGGISSGVTSKSWIDRVMIYASNMISLDGSDINNYAASPNPYNDNVLLSLPVALFSHTRNVGIGTFTNDKAGMFEPTARMHSHADWRSDKESFNTITSYTGEGIGSFDYSVASKPWLDLGDYVPIRRMKSGAFTIERNSPADIYGDGQGGVFDGTKYEVAPSAFSDWYGKGVFNDILIGAVAPMDKEPEYVDDRMQTYLQPTAGIRYESFNYTGPISVLNAKPSRNYGWGYKGALRLGTSPYHSQNSNTITTDEIGKNANLQASEYQFTLSPLSFASAPSSSSRTDLLTGIGLHNIYPRTRLHLYGKNFYQEFRFDEAYSPGSENTATGPGADPAISLWGALPSNNQITVDYLGESYWYNAAMYDYAYDYLVLKSGIVGATQYSANARNYPTKEAGATSVKTRSTYRQTNNFSAISTAAASLNSYQSLHGGVDNAYWAVDKYIGFNAFRDLLGKGDEKGEVGPSYINAPAGGSYDRYASNWRFGTEGKDGKEQRDAQNGGSLILTDTYGRMGFSFIPAYRDGGENYGRWEQQNVGTREVVDNIKIVFDEKGNVGIGNAPGYDSNAYPSLRYNPTKGVKVGTIWYLPNAGPGISDPTATGPQTYSSLRSMGAFTPVYTDRYGMGLSVAGTSYAGYDTATINTKATLDEYIRFEISGEKANTRVGFNTQRRGYGYPGWTSATSTGLPTKTAATGNATSTIVITDNATQDFARRYWGSGGAVGWASAVHTFKFDNIGRLISYSISFPSPSPGWDTGDDLLVTYTNFRMPHPRDFGPGAPFGENFPNTAAYPWTAGMTMTRTINSVDGGVTSAQPIWIPASAAAAELDRVIVSAEAGVTATATVAVDPLQTAVMRLNNFSLGEGYQFVRQNGDVLDTDITDPALNADESLTATKQIYDQRTSSPKLLLTYGAVDYDALTAAGVNSAEAANLISAGLAPLMKVTTVIESAQNETGLRTYTIPKADSTGGSFMVITDHMGQREIDSPTQGLVPLPENIGKTRIRLDKVVAHEVVRTGYLNTGTYSQTGYLTTRNGFEPFVPPVGPGDPTTSYPTSYELLPIHYTKGAGFYSSALSSYILPAISGTQQVFTDPTVVNLGGNANPNSNAGIGANIVRDLDAYWEMEQDVFTGVLRDENNQPIQDQKSEIRYRRLNESYVLFDFNINLRAMLVETISAMYDYEGASAPTFGGLDEVFGYGSIAGGFDPTEDLHAFTHSPHAPGRLISQFRYYDGDDVLTTTNKNIWLGVDARWVQYVRFTFDLKKDALAVGTDDPFYYKYQYGGGANFRNFNEFRPWYPGTATVGPNALNSNYRDNLGALGWNVSDGYQNVGTITSGDSIQYPDAGTGYGYTQPKDGSPYSVWSETSGIVNASVTNYVARYWNGRMNDWHASRWSVSNSAAAWGWGSITSQAVAGAGLRNPVHDYDARTLAHTVTHDPALGAREWQDWERLSPNFTVWPTQNASGYGGTGAYNNIWTPWVNQYAYKQYWKWFLPVIAKPSLALPAMMMNFYVEHPQVMDDVIYRSFGDDAWIRNSGIQWRITPVANGSGDRIPPDPLSVTQTAINYGENVTFAVEVMFDKPLFVSGRTLARWNSGKYNIAAFNGNTNIGGRNADGTIDTSTGSPIDSTAHVNTQSEFLGGINDLQWAAQASLLGGTEVYSPLSDITLRGQSVIKYQETNSYELTSYGISPEEGGGGGPAGGGGGELG